VGQLSPTISQEAQFFEWHIVVGGNGRGCLQIFKAKGLLFSHFTIFALSVFVFIIIIIIIILSRVKTHALGITVWDPRGYSS